MLQTGLQVSGCSWPTAYGSAPLRLRRSRGNKRYTGSGGVRAIHVEQARLESLEEAFSSGCEGRRRQGRDGRDPGAGASAGDTPFIYMDRGPTSQVARPWGPSLQRHRWRL
jgi:hypothetical protein